MSPTASSSRSRRSPKPAPKSMPKASCSRSNQPPPEAEDEPAVGQVVDGRGELRGEPGVAERVGGDKQAEAGPVGQHGQRRQRRPALELGVGRVALVGEQVVVDPEGVPAGTFGRQARVAQVRPVRPVDPECRPEAHGSSDREAVQTPRLYRAAASDPAAILGRVEAVSRRSFNSRLFRWHAGATPAAADPRGRGPVAGARRRGDVAADRDRARRPGLAAVRGSLADAGRPGRAPGRTSCSRRGQGSATTGGPWRCANVRGRSSRTMAVGCRRRSPHWMRCPGSGRTRRERSRPRRSASRSRRWT